MSALPLATVLALAASCQSVVAPSTIAGIAQHESDLDPRAVNHNADGSTDLGLMQVNSKNLAWLGLTNPFDPCQSIAAAARLLANFSRYNTGSPTAGLSYALKVKAAIGAVSATPGATPSVPASRSPCAPAWDAWALAACSKSPGKNN